VARLKLGHIKRRQGYVRTRTLGSMPVAYSKYLNDTLRERLVELSGGSVEAQLDLREELALAKMTVEDVVSVYSATCQAAETLGPDHAGAAEAKLYAGQQLRSTLKDLFDLAERLAKIAYSPTRAQIPVALLGMVLDQVVTEAYDVFGEEPEVIQKINELSTRIKSVRLPSLEGTTITPDMDVTAMDRTIPDSPEEPHELKVAQ